MNNKQNKTGSRSRVIEFDTLHIYAQFHMHLFLITDLDSMTLTNTMNCKIYGSMEGNSIRILYVSFVNS